MLRYWVLAQRVIQASACPYPDASEYLSMTSVGRLDLWLVFN